MGSGGDQGVISGARQGRLHPVVTIHKDRPHRELHQNKPANPARGEFFARDFHRTDQPMSDLQVPSRPHKHEIKGLTSTDVRECLKLSELKKSLIARDAQHSALSTQHSGLHFPSVFHPSTRQ